MKWCKFCETEKPLHEFHNLKRSPDGRNPRCIGCIAEQNRIRIEKQKRELSPTRVCLVCKKEKKTTEGFSKTPNGPGGYQTRCKECCSEASAKWRWGIENILSLVDSSVCDICGEGLERNNYAVDHDHSCCPSRIRSCGKCVRGLICQNCNIGLGGFRDNTEIMLKAMQYLKRFSDA